MPHMTDQTGEPVRSVGEQVQHGPLAQFAADRLLSFVQLREIVGLSRSTIWRKEREGRFPHRVKLSANRVGWRESEVCEWMFNLGAGGAA